MLIRCQHLTRRGQFTFVWKQFVLVLVMERSEPKLAPEWLRSVGNKPASSSASSLQLGEFCGCF